MPSLIRKREGKRTSKRTGKTVKTVSWMVQVPTGKNEKGQTEYLRRTFKLERDAKTYLEERIEEKRAGGVIKPSELTTAVYLRQWLEEARASLRENTAESYGRVIAEYLEPDLGRRKLCDLQPIAIQRVYRKLLERGLSARTVRYAHSILHNALSQAVKWRMLSANPAAGLELPKRKPVREMHPLDQPQAKLFLEVARVRDEKGKPVYRLGAFFELALTTGMRPSEIFGLRWPDVDLKTGMVRVRHALVRDKEGWRLREPKTARGKRSIPLPPQTVEALQDWKRAQAEERMEAGSVWKGEGNPADGFVFTTLTGEPLDISNVAKRDLVGVAKAAGLAEEIPPKPPRKKPTYKSRVTLYDLRHTCATLMLAAGVNPKVASERLGHASVVITLDTYSHVLPTMQQDATEKLGNALYS